MSTVEHDLSVFLSESNEDTTNYYLEDDSVLSKCGLKCGRLEHRQSENGLCAHCEVSAHADELQFRWLTNPTNSAALVEAEVELRVWQNLAKETL